MPESDGNNGAAQAPNADELHAQLQAAQAELAGARESIARLERRQKIDAMLAESDAVDLEVARLLTEAAVTAMDEPDVKLAVDDLRRSKPYLFRRRQGGASAMPARQRDFPEAPRSGRPSRPR